MKKRVRITNLLSKNMIFPVGRLGLIIPPGDGTGVSEDTANKNLITEEQWAAVCKLKSAQQFIAAGKLVGPEVSADVAAAPTTKELLTSEIAKQDEAKLSALVAEKPKGPGKGPKVKEPTA